MAAFTSVADGDWKTPATWGEATEYPFKSSAADTVTVNHAVSISADNALAGTGTVVIASGGNLYLSSAYSSAQNFCGDITIASGGKLSSVSNANTKKLQVGGHVIGQSGGEFNWQKVSNLYFNSTATCYGLDIQKGCRCIMAGTSSESKDSQITGHTTNGCYWNITGGSLLPGQINISNVTLSYTKMKAGQDGGLFMQLLNRSNESEAVIDGLAQTNVLGATYPLFIYGCTCTNFTNISSGNTSTNRHGIYIGYCTIKGTNSFTGGSGATTIGISIWYSRVIDGGSIFNGSTTAGKGIYLAAVTVRGNSIFNGAATTGIAIYVHYNELASGIFNGTATTGTGIYWEGPQINGGTHTANATPGASGGTAFKLTSNTEIAGDAVLISTGSKNGIWCITNVPDLFTAGNISISGAYNAIQCDANEASSTTFQKNTDLEIKLLSFTNLFGTTPIWNEPLIYRNHASNKTAIAYYECAPFNLTDFTTSGVTRNGMDMDIAAGGSIVSPSLRPFDVSQWTSISFATSGGSPTVYTRTSSDGGSNWTGWTTRANAADLSGISVAGKGADLIQWKLENASGTCTLQNVTITFSYKYDSIQWESTTGIQTLTANNDATLDAGWNGAAGAGGSAATYRLYIRAGSAPDSFGTASSYFLCETADTAFTIAQDAAGAALADGTAYYVIVRAVDAAGNEDTNTTTLSAEADLYLPPAPDVTPPVWDTTTGIQTLIADDDLALDATWGSATDAEAGTVKYRIYIRSGAAPNTFGVDSIYYLCETAALAFTIAQDAAGAPLADGTTYYVIVRAVDAAGNEDTNTTSLNAEADLVSYPAPDVTPPVWDSTTGIQSLTDNTDLSLSAEWNSATDAGGGTEVYRIYIRAGAAPDSFGLSSPYFLCETPLLKHRIASTPNGVALVAGTTYHVIVRAADDAGNEETNSTSLSETATLPSGTITINYPVSVAITKNEINIEVSMP